MGGVGGPEVMTNLPCAESISLLKISIPDLDPEEYHLYVDKGQSYVGMGYP